MIALVEQNADSHHPVYPQPSDTAPKTWQNQGLRLLHLSCWVFSGRVVREEGLVNEAQRQKRKRGKGERESILKKEKN
jgi:hypothetical protein